MVVGGGGEGGGTVKAFGVVSPLTAHQSHHAVSNSTVGVSREDFTAIYFQNFPHRVAQKDFEENTTSPGRCICLNGLCS